MGTGRAEAGASPRTPPRCSPHRSGDTLPRVAGFHAVLGRVLQKKPQNYRVPAEFGPGRGWVRETAGKALGTGCRLSREGKGRRGEAGALEGREGGEGLAGGGQALGRSQIQEGMEGRRLRAGRGARSPPVASRTPARSCLAFVGLSWTL